MGLGGGSCVAQDEKDTYTFHFMVTEDVAEKLETFDAVKAIKDGMGGWSGPCNIVIDEVLVKGFGEVKLPWRMCLRAKRETGEYFSQGTQVSSIC